MGPDPFLANRAMRQRDLENVFGLDPNSLLSQREAARRASKKEAREQYRTNRRRKSNLIRLEKQSEEARRAEKALITGRGIQFTSAYETGAATYFSRTQSLSGKTKKSSTFNRRGFKKSLMNDFTVTKNFDQHLTIPDPATMKPGSLEYYAREKVLYPRFETQARLRGMQIFEEVLANDNDNVIRSMDEVELEKLSQAYIQSEQRLLFKQHLADLKRYYGPGYRQYLRDVATNNIQSLREEAYYNRGWKISTQDPYRKKPILPISMSKEEAINYISKRVSADGGTLARSKNLPGFDDAVAQISSQGILSKQEVSKIIQDKNLLHLTPNARQLAEALDAEELMRLPYGDALRIANPLQGPSYSQQQLAMKKEWMTEDAQIIKEREKAIFELDKQQKLAAHAENRQALKDLYEADKQQKISDYRARRAEAQAQAQAARVKLAQEEKIKAFISSNTGDPNAKITIFDSAIAETETAISNVTAKKPISMKTVERLMSSHTLAAGVAAGGLGIMYAMNRRRGEEQVGR